MLIQTIELPTPPPFNEIYEYPTLEQITRPDGVRHYRCPDGLLVPSATTILSGTADKEGLKQWREWVGDKKADQARDEGAALGTLVHEHMERYLDGGQRPGGTNLIRQMSKRMADVMIQRGMSGVDEVWGSEKQLYHSGLYAGTCDLMGVYKGRPAIMDYKNAKKMRTWDMILDYGDQVCAYAMAHNHLFGTDIQTGVIFMVSRDLSFNTFIVEGEQFDAHCVRFLTRLEKYLMNDEAAAG